MEIYTLENLSFTYAGNKEPTLKNICASVSEGDFVLLCGSSGSGKSTLLSMLKKELIPKGSFEGRVCFEGADLRETDHAVSVQNIGFCAQNPETQQVFDRVSAELGFVLENLNVPEEQTAVKIAETLSFFSMEDLYGKRCSELSGGEKQLVNLAVSVVAEPKVLLLDEPFSRLDAFSRERLFNLLRRLNDELGVTVILAEHELTGVLPAANRIWYLSEGVLRELSKDGLLREALKTDLGLVPARVYRMLGGEGGAGSIPSSVSECRRYVSAFDVVCPKKEETADAGGRETVAELKNVYFRYEKDAPDVLKGLTLPICRGEILSVIGCNGSGKTTLSSLLSGKLRPYAGRVRADKSVRFSVLPQNPRLLFKFDTVIQVLHCCGRAFGCRELFRELNSLNPEKDMELSREALELVRYLQLEALLYQNPFDLSVGQQQLTALAAVLLIPAEVVVLDEPTKGVDAERKKLIAQIMLKLKANGKTVVHITHDLNFAAETSDRCALLFDGKIAVCRDTASFMRFSRNYTSDVAKIFSKVEARNRPVSLREVKICEIKRRSN